MLANALHVTIRDFADGRPHITAQETTASWKWVYDWRLFVRREQMSLLGQMFPAAARVWQQVEAQEEFI